MAYHFTEKGSEQKQQVLEQLCIKYQKLMKHVANRILNDTNLSEDAVQNAFIKLGRNKFQIESISCNKTKSLMVIIVRNSAIEIYNNKKKTKTVSFEDDEDLKNLPDDNILPLDVVIGNENFDEIYRTINELDTKYSDILVMKYIENYSNYEIASIFGISEQLVRVRLYRGKKLLIDALNGGEVVNE